MSLNQPCSVCGATCGLSKSDAVDAGWNFMKITAPITVSMALCPKDSKTHVHLFTDKIREAYQKLGANPKKVSISVKLPTGDL